MNPNHSSVFLRPASLFDLAGEALPTGPTRSWWSVFREARRTLGRTLGQSLGFPGIHRSAPRRDDVLQGMLHGLQEEIAAAFELEGLGLVHIEARKGRLIKVNRAFCALLGIPREDLLSRPFLELAVPEDRLDGKQGLLELSRGMRKRWSAVLRLRKSGGGEVQVKLAGTLLQATDALPMRVLASVQDITAARQGEDRLREAEDRIRRSERMEALGRSAGEAVHDLQNLVTAIGGFSELLTLGGIPEDRQRDYAFEIGHCARRASDLVRGILNPDSVRSPAAVVDLNRLVSGVTRMLRGQLGEGIRLSTMISDMPPLIHADSDRLERILFNLAANARDAMPLGGELALRAYSRRLDAGESAHGLEPIPAGHYGCLEIEDTGHGMDPASLERLFKVFHTTKGPRGTGLGLASAREHVKEAGGYIQVRSGEGQGTLFRLCFPRVHAELPDERPTRREV